MKYLFKNEYENQLTKYLFALLKIPVKFSVIDSFLPRYFLRFHHISSFQSSNLKKAPQLNSVSKLLTFHYLIQHMLHTHLSHILRAVVFIIKYLKKMLRRFLMFIKPLHKSIYLVRRSFKRVGLMRLIINHLYLVRIISLLRPSKRTRPDI